MNTIILNLFFKMNIIFTNIIYIYGFVNSGDNLYKHNTNNNNNHNYNYNHDNDDNNVNNEKDRHVSNKTIKIMGNICIIIVIIVLILIFGFLINVFFGELCLRPCIRKIKYYWNRNRNRNRNYYDDYENDDNDTDNDDANYENNTINNNINYSIININDLLIKYNNSDNSDNKESCSICIEEFKNDTDNKIILKLKCEHLFHKECLDPWLNTNKSCPLCRIKLEIV
jgi:hypothetical protein